MKRADLKVGETYYYSRSNVGWMDTLFSGAKVVIVDLGCWEEHRLEWSRRPATIEKVSKGSGILVDMTTKKHPSGEEKTVRTVVSTGTIRGLYEETVKLIEERSEQRRQQSKELQERTEKRNAEADAAVTLAKENGFVVRQTSYGSKELVINADELTRLIHMTWKES